MHTNLKNLHYICSVEDALVNLQAQLKVLDKPVRGLQASHEPNGFFYARTGTIRQRTYHTRLLGDVTQSQLQPKEKKHVTTDADYPRVSFQTIEHGAYYRTFETELIQSSRKKGKVRGQICPSQSPQESKPVSSMGLKTKKQSNRKKRKRDVLKQSWCGRTASELRKKATPFELMFRIKLLDAGFYRHRFQKYFILNRSIYIVDFFIPELKIAIEIDGEYHNTPDQLKKDNKRSNKLIKSGFVNRIIRIQNEAVDSLTADQIKSIIGHED